MFRELKPEFKKKQLETDISTVLVDCEQLSVRMSLVATEKKNNRSAALHAEIGEQKSLPID